MIFKRVRVLLAYTSFSKTNDDDDDDDDNVVVNGRVKGLPLLFPLFWKYSHHSVCCMNSPSYLILSLWISLRLYSLSKVLDLTSKLETIISLATFYSPAIHNRGHLLCILKVLTLAYTIEEGQTRLWKESVYLNVSQHVLWNQMCFDPSSVISNVLNLCSSVSSSAKWRK